MFEDKFVEIKRILWLLLFANLAVAAAKIIMGTIINSSSVTADGFHSLSDGSSNIIGLIGVCIAAKPVDEDHPYGHRKYETLTGLFIVAMLTYLGLKIIFEAIGKFSNPVPMEISLWSFAVILVTLVVNIVVAKYEHRKGLELNSTILISDSKHTQSDVYITLGVIVTLVAVKLGAPPVVDALASLVVAGFILHAAYEIFISASGVLVDSSVVDEEEIRQLVMSNQHVKGVHKIRSRGTLDDMYIDMHILADPMLSLEISHQLAHDIEDAIREKYENNAEVIIHVEPYEER